ncbi:MAG: response regulator, partial [Lachnospiraceae bacterium]|nr:response regulator [Lachnospiraceae bacterium]
MIDHRMPVMDGMEMIVCLRADKENPNVDKPCIALTANAVAGAREEYIAAGFNDYLVKPVNGARLEKLLVKYLPPEMVQKTEDTESATESEYAGFAIFEEKGYLNIRDGIEYAGSEEMYRNVLKFFLDTIDAKCDEIRGYYDSGDWENYQTKVHALKSSAKVVGAEELSDRARSL